MALQSIPFFIKLAISELNHSSSWRDYNNDICIYWFKWIIEVYNATLQQY